MSNEKRKKNWKFYVGLFCAVGAVVMLTVNIWAAIAYAVLAVILLRGFIRPGVTAAANAAPVPQRSAQPAQKKAPKIPLPDCPYSEKTYRVTGVHHYEDGILTLASADPCYDLSKQELIEANLVDTTVWKYHFASERAEVIPEPENPYDKNAIRVIVDGVHVGYIKAGSCAHLLKVLSEGRVLGICCEIGGGPYKMVVEEDSDDDRPEYSLEKDESPFHVTLTIFEAQ